MSFVDRINARPLVFDGAMGTMIYERGVFINTCYDEMSLRAPQLITSIHREYVEAGADVIETNTFGANRFKLQSFGLAEKVEEINRTAVNLAREAVGEGGDTLIAGSVGPCTHPDQALPQRLQADVEGAFGEQIRTLVEAGVDLILLETFSRLTELQLAIQAAKGFGLPIVASFTVNAAGETAVGTKAEMITDFLSREDAVHAIGVNCGTGPAGAFDALHLVIPRSRKPVVVMPNAGFPSEVNGRLLYLSNPEYFTEYAKRYIELGVRGVGGCCGTTPEHIRMAAKAVGSMSGVKRHVEIAAYAAQEDEEVVETIPVAERSRLAERLAAGKMVTSVELLPPRSTVMTGLLKKAAACKEAGVDAINIPDGPRASARVSPMIASIAIEQQVGIETVLHYCCRDRNLIGMQSDLLGGYAAGLRNFLIVTGDPPKLGDYPDATGVFDVDAIGLTQVVNNLNHGRDIGGARVKPPTGIFIGVGANPVAVDMNREIERYYRKIDAGAEFAITQPIFDVEALFRFLDTVGSYERQIPVLAGVWPLLSFRNAEFMNNEVPGVVVPDWILERMSKCQTKEDGRAAGIEIAQETIAAIGDRVQGIQVSAPLGITSIALAVIADVLEKNGSESASDHPSVA